MPYRSATITTNSIYRRVKIIQPQHQYTGREKATLNKRTEIQPTTTITNVPNLSTIIMDKNMEDGLQDSQSHASGQSQTRYNYTIMKSQQWRQDANTLSETDCTQKHYNEAIMVLLPMERYLGLRTGQLLNIALQVAAARAQLRRCKGMQFLDITTLMSS
jgi:hypothetical protein